MLYIAEDAKSYLACDLCALYKLTCPTRRADVEVVCRLCMLGALAVV